MLPLGVGFVCLTLSPFDNKGNLFLVLDVIQMLLAHRCMLGGWKHKGITDMRGAHSGENRIYFSLKKWKDLRGLGRERIPKVSRVNLFHCAVS